MAVTCYPNQCVRETSSSYIETGKRKWFRSCCGEKMWILRNVITATCKKCSSKEWWTRGYYAACRTCNRHDIESCTGDF